MWPFSRRKQEPPSPEALEARGELAGLVALLGDPDAFLGQRARAALVRLRAEDVLRGACSEDPRAPARALALRALAELKPADLDAVLRARLEDPDPGVRRLAAELGARPASLRPGAATTPEAVLALGNAGSEATAALLDALKAADPAVRRAAAAVARARLSAGAPPPPLAKAVLDLERDPDPAVRAVSADALPSLGAPGAEALLRLLEDPEPQVRQHAAAALGAGGVSEAIPALTRKLRDGDWAAARALGALRADAARAELIAALADPRIGAVAATALAEIGAREAIPAIRAFIARAPAPSGPDGDPDEREIARAALRALGET